MKKAKIPLSWFWLIAMALFSSFLPVSKWSENPLEIWLIQEDFFSYGKRDTYEAITKTWLTALKQANTPQELMTMVAIQSKTNPEYIYMSPIGRFGILDNYLPYVSRIDTKLGPEVVKKQQEAWLSTLNFQTFSLMGYLPFCSCLPRTPNSSIPHRPYVHYYIIGVDTKSADYFENFLKTQVDLHNAKNETICWRTWKVLFGSDVPKYVVAIFSRSEEELKKHKEQLDLTDPLLEKVLRREREGWGVLRRDLSIFSSSPTLAPEYSEEKK